MDQVLRNNNYFKIIKIVIYSALPVCQEHVCVISFYKGGKDYFPYFRDRKTDFKRVIPQLKCLKMANQLLASIYELSFLQHFIGFLSFLL